MFSGKWSYLVRRLLRILSGAFGRGSPMLTGEFELIRVTQLRVTARRRATLRCTSGKAWVTFEFDPQDYFLLCGQTVTIAAGRRAFIKGIPECSLSIRFAPQVRRLNVALPEVSDVSLG
jgi:hypothetical protein